MFQCLWPWKGESGCWLWSCWNEMFCFCIYRFFKTILIYCWVREEEAQAQASCAITQLLHGILFLLFPFHAIFCDCSNFAHQSSVVSPSSLCSVVNVSVFDLISIILWDPYNTALIVICWRFEGRQVPRMFQHVSSITCH